MRVRKKDLNDRISSEVDENTFKSQNFELHTMPIKENSPESKSIAQEIVADNRSEVNTNCNENQRTDRIIPPVPAPRKLITNKSTKHTYQNVPIPITPNTQGISTEQVSYAHLL
jgi:hypothetical protein